MELDKAITHQEASRRARPSWPATAQPEIPSPLVPGGIRRELEKRFGAEQVHEAGLKVQTTLDLDLQQTATEPSPTALLPTSAAMDGIPSLKTSSPAEPPLRTTDIPTGP